MLSRLGVGPLLLAVPWECRVLIGSVAGFRQSCVHIFRSGGRGVVVAVGPGASASSCICGDEMGKSWE